MDELDAWLRLARTPGLHIGHLRPLLASIGSILDIVSASCTTLRATGLPPSLANALSSVDASIIDSDRRWLEAGHEFIAWGSPRYPTLLAQIPDAPVGLYVSGDASHLAKPQLAIVGARNPTPSGSRTAESFAKHLARCGLAITSGLAAGIDSASHRGALASGSTIAVCATGLDIVYPRSSKALAEEIASRGCLVSEFPPGTQPHKRYFPQRNRIISGIALGTLVVEAAVRSGSLITARLAAEQGREVFAVPGSIHNPLSRGCHQLLRNGAKLVETVDDILSELGPLGLVHATGTMESTDPTQVPGCLLDKPNKMLLDAFGFEPASVDLLIERTGLEAREVASMLLILELEGHIESFPGGQYMRSQPEATK
jgi:DNA processing protein